MKLRHLTYLLLLSLCFSGSSCPPENDTYQNPQTGLLELQSTDGGIVWRGYIIKLSSPEGGVQDYLHRLLPFTPYSNQTPVCVITSTDYDVRAVGNHCSIYRKPSFDGVTWSFITELDHINDMTSAGTTGKGFFIGSNFTDKRIYKTTDFGTNWSVVHQSPLGEVDWNIIDFGGELHGIVLPIRNTDSVMRTFDGGQTWTTCPPVNVTTTVLNSLEILNSQDSIAVACGSRNKILRTTNLGQSWLPATNNNNSVTLNLKSVDFLGSTGIIAGDDGTIFRSTDRGASWTQVTSGTEKNLQRVFLTDSKFWIIGNGIILTSGNQGLTWQIARDVEGEFYEDIISDNSNRIIVVGRKDY